MKFTEKRAIKIINSIKCYEAKESIETYPEEERDGKSELEIILNELEYFVYMFEEVDGAYSDDLYRSREILRRTCNGKSIPIDRKTFKPIYPSWRIEQAKRTVNEYRQLKRLVSKLREEV